MSGLATLIKLAERRVQQAVLDWQRLTARRDDARGKLARLQHYRQVYRDLMQTGLRDGMPAATIVAHIGFIAQIDAVVVRQQSELGELEAACAQHFDAVVNARREQRIYEILSEQIRTRAATAASRRQHLETGEILQRAARTRPTLLFDP